MPLGLDYEPRIKGPSAEPPETKQAGECAGCGGEIYAGQTYYDLDGDWCCCVACAKDVAFEQSDCKKRTATREGV